jgi:hypothetical protein
VAGVRCVLYNDYYEDKSDGVKRQRKLLIFTTNIGDIYCISTEDSIATNSFDKVQYPYFDVAGYDESELIKLGVPTPYACIPASPVARAEDDKKHNSLAFKGFQWRIKNIDVFGRESEHGIISDRWFLLVGGGCIANSGGLSRCVDLIIEAGGPLVDKIQIEYRTCSGNSDLSQDSEWVLYETVNKYNNCEQNKWYERSVRNPWQDKYDELKAAGKTDDEATEGADGLLKYNGDNTFTYRFCADKECQPIPASETARTQNRMPLETSSVFLIDKELGTCNNLRGFEPLSCEQLKKVSFSVVPPSGDSQCGEANKLRKVVVYANIWNMFLDSPSISRYKDGVPCFGIADCNKNNPLAYDQVFADGQKGFIGYLAGTPYYDISTQVWHEFGVPDVILGLEKLEGFDLHWLQKWEFLVPPGKYIFRIASHLATPKDDYQKTSTYTKGKARFNPNGKCEIFEHEVKELIIDVCENDYLSDTDNFEMLQIYDLTCDGRRQKVNLKDCWGSASTIVDGYLYEDEVSNIPIECAKVDAGVFGGDKYHSWTTDHNGFFFVAGNRKNIYADIYVRKCDGGDSNAELHITSKEALDNYNKGGHVKHDTVFVCKGEEEFPDAGRRIIEGKIELCGDKSIGVAGVLVCITKGRPTFTDSSGKYRLVLHNRWGQFAAPNDGDTVIISQKGACRIVDCENSCLSCFNDYDVAYVGCAADRTTTLETLKVSLSGVNIMGPQTGGRYGLGLIMYDWMGRCSFVQADDSFYVDIPSLLDTKAFLFSKIQWAMQAGIVFPSWVKYVTFCITENLNQDDFLTWAVDKVEFTDGGGVVNNVSPTQVRIYYESITQYNKQNNFATTTNWQFISSKENEEQSVIGDQVQFLINGDGKWFDKNIVSIVRYDKDGKYFTIDYSDDLKDLTQGGLIKLIRPKQCVNKYLYYELCPAVKVINGVPEVLAGDISYSDSYFLSRQIPVPNDVDIVVNGQTTTKTEIETRNFDFLFEHPSPSDLWGSRCRSGGRVNIKNPYEKQQRRGSEIALSKAITQNGTFNGLSYFSDEDISEFDVTEWGNFVGVLPEVNVLLVICEKDSFLTSYAQSDVKISADNVLVAEAPIGRFARPQRKIGKNFGCQFRDINTIAKTDGVVLWLDSNKSALVLHGYGDALSISDAADSGYKTWIRQKVAFRNVFNLTAPDGELMYFHAEIDPLSKKYFLTAFRRGGDLSYTNTEEDVAYDKNETACIDINTGALDCYVGFTPACYVPLEGFYKTPNLFMITGAEAWVMYGESEQFSACNFFGVQDKKVMKLIYNEQPEKVKRFLYNEVYCKEHRFIASRVVTEAGQLSRILAIHWKKAERFYMAPFLGATNAVFAPGAPDVVKNNPLFEGGVLSGRWMVVTYESGDGDHDKYCEISAVCAYMMEVEKSG